MQLPVTSGHPLAGGCGYRLALPSPVQVQRVHHVLRCRGCAARGHTMIDRRFSRRALGALLLSCAGLAAAATPTPPAKATPVPPTDVPIKGHAMAIGGALKSDNDEVWNRLVALAGGKGARFVVFGTAAEDPEASAKQVVDQLQRRGAIAEALPVAPRFSWVDLSKVVRDPALIAKVRAAKGVFFTGGSQERIVDVLYPGGHTTPMLDAIWEVYRKGGVVAGTSAGAAIMSTVMFRDAPSVISILKGQWEEARALRPHGAADAGQRLPSGPGRGRELRRRDPRRRGRDPRPQGRAAGGSGGGRQRSRAGRVQPQGRQAHLSRSRRSVEPDHARGDALSGEAARPAAGTGAADYKPYYTLPQFYTDMLGDSTISTAMSILIDSVQPEGPGSIGWSTDELGPEDYTVVNLYLDVTPVRMPMPLFGAWPGERRPKRDAPPEEPPAGERPQQP
ncbi:peptidase family s51 domain-containing protein [Ditylenchus destructor]|nr:peptidase family s51 domain-containing protein [Ditylenchus destructor]